MLLKTSRYVMRDLWRSRESDTDCLSTQLCALACLTIQIAQASPTSIALGGGDEDNAALSRTTESRSANIDSDKCESDESSLGKYSHSPEEQGNTDGGGIASSHLHSQVSCCGSENQLNGSLCKPNLSELFFLPPCSP